MRSSLESTTEILVGARSSPLSKAQVKEVLEELNQFHPDVRFEPVFVETTGDKDQKTSLRTLDKTDFFTKEVDEMQLQGRCRISIHSAKDLPEPIPQGLKIVAVTKGKDPRDALVLRQGESLSTLAPGAIIATSSERREEAARELRSDFRFIDLRGTIGQRLALLQEGKADGVIVAEAALLRLGLEHLNRVYLPGATAQFQGQLAILARNDDKEMEDLFACLDARKKILYLGLDCPTSSASEIFVHHPLIKIVPRETNSELEMFRSAIQNYTHIIFTSKTAVRLLLDLLTQEQTQQLKKIHCVAVGKKTAAALNQYGITAQTIAQMECAEGIITELQKMDLKNARIFWPHSAISRSIIADELIAQSIELTECVLYDTFPQQPEKNVELAQFNEIVFTSPSCVDAFVEFYDFPKNVQLTPIGPITKQHLVERMAKPL